MNLQLRDVTEIWSKTKEARRSRAESRAVLWNINSRI